VPLAVSSSLAPMRRRRGRPGTPTVLQRPRAASRWRVSPTTSSRPGRDVDALVLRRRERPPVRRVCVVGQPSARRERRLDPRRSLIRGHADVDMHPAAARLGRVQALERDVRKLVANNERTAEESSAVRRSRGAHSPGRDRLPATPRTRWSGCRRRPATARTPCRLRRRSGRRTGPCRPTGRRPMRRRRRQPPRAPLPRCR
jgi:hypothetical protein